MRTIATFIALAWMTIFASPSYAVTPQAADIFFLGPASVNHIDMATGVETLVSCWGLEWCSPLIGTGPPLGTGFYGELEEGPDGWIYMHWIDLGSSSCARIDPSSGNREIVATTSSAGHSGYEVWPARG